MDKASDFGSEDYRFESCHGRKNGLLFEGSLGGSSSKEFACNAGVTGNAGLTPGSAWRIPWAGKPNGLQSAGSQSQTRLKQPGMHVIVEKSRIAT